MSDPYTVRSEPWGFRARATRPHDGDSFWILCDTGFGSRFEPELRLDGVHAPEVIPMQPGGQETTDYVNGWLSSHSSAVRKWPLWADIVMEQTFEPDMHQTFTRYVATVYPFDARGERDSLNYSVNVFLSGHPEWPPGK